MQDVRRAGGGGEGPLQADAGQAQNIQAQRQDCWIWDTTGICCLAVWTGPVQREDTGGPRQVHLEQLGGPAGQHGQELGLFSIVDVKNIEKEVVDGHPASTAGSERLLNAHWPP